MTNRFLSAVLITSSLALAANEPSVDAFLSRKDTRPLVDPRGMTSIGRAAFSAGLVTSIEPRLGVPTFFWAAPQPGARSYRDMGLSPAQAARRYLLSHAELYRGETTRWAEAQVSSVHDLHDGGAVIVTFQQRVRGVRVFRDELKVIMTAKLGLVALAGYLTPETRPQGDFSLSAESAIGSAFQTLVGRTLLGHELTQLGQFEGGYEHWRLAGATTPVRTRAVYFPVPEGVVPGFYVELDVPTSEQDSQYFSFVVSAVDGAVLYSKNLTAADSFTYKVWADTTAPFLPFDGPQGLGATPHPTGTPSNFDPGNVPQNLVTLEHAGLSTLDPWLAPGATQTLGNNVRAYADITRNNGFTQASDPIAVTTSMNTFEYTYNFNVGPEANMTQRQAAVAQLFFDNNLFHDWYYDDGFNEAAGNGQLSNLGRGGLGNDALLAEAQDYSGRSNANMSTPSDGSSPRMQMYLFDGNDAASVTANTATAQSFNTLGADFGQQVHNLTAPLMLANDGSTTPTGTATLGTVSDACQTLPAGSAAGKILLIDRGGGCTFVLKAEHGQAAGALGVIIANNSTQAGPVPLVGTSTTSIPVMSVSLNSGNTLKGIITSGGGATTVTMTRSAATNRDGTLDNGVVAHEWGHYISNRLIGDGNGISNLQAVGMGEGWADFHAGLMMARESDAAVASNANWNGAFGLAGWAGFTTDPNAYYYGFRRYPLSADFAKNPLTFKHISDGIRLPTTAPLAFGASGADNSEVHNTGEVWAAMLWECYVAMLRDPRHTFAQAQALMKRYLVAAYKATPLMPTFVDARDAVLAVAAANNSDDFALLWAAFARRGIGMGAVAPDRDSQTNSPVVESFVIGNAVTVTSITLNDGTTSCDNDGNLDANEVGTLTVQLKNTGTGTLSAANVAVTTTTTGITFPQGASVVMPSTAPFGVATVSFAVAMADVAGSQGGSFTVVITDPSLAMGPITSQALFRLNFDMVPNSSRLDDVESPMTTWTASSDPNLNTGSNFRVFASTATQHYWFGPNPASPADTHLTSPPLQVGAGPATIAFKHRFDFERNTTEFFDGAVLEVSSNGGATWTDIGTSSTPGYTGTLTTSQNQSSNPLMGQRAFVGKSLNYPTFNAETIDLGTRFANQTIQLRFRIGADDAAAAKGWEIDDIQLTGITNKPFTSVTSDPNTCTNGAPTATIGPNVEVNEREALTLVGGGTDPDGDPVTVTWTQLTGPAISITGSTFVAPNVDADTNITLQMTVTDGRAVTMPLEQTVLVKNVNRLPIATVPATMEATMGEIVTVLGSGADADGEPLTFQWSHVSGPTAELSGAATDDVTFQAPAITTPSEVVRLQLVVRDRTEASEPAFVDITVKNPNVVIEEPKPKGCGCTTGLELLPLAALGLMFRARRKRS
ncbi:MAG: myxosortase-dependent M36 family metallopeptidase [Archangium sp.]|nr:myxosortase-dependent M36 family metallopeptidase [Archangium sp.]